MTKLSLRDRMANDLDRAESGLGWVQRWDWEWVDDEVTGESIPGEAAIVDHHDEDGDEVRSRLTLRGYAKAEKNPRFNPDDADSILATALNAARKLTTPNY